MRFLSHRFSLRITNSLPRIQVLFIGLFLLGMHSVTAQTAGPNNAGAGSNLATTGTINWVNPGNILADDVSYATVSLSGGQVTRYLYGSSYGFSIPAGSVINGISVAIRRQIASSAGARRVRDASVRLVKAGAVVGNNYAYTTTDWPTSMTQITYGGATDLWGTTWTSADINATTFGVALSGVANAGPNASIDDMQITVYFTPPPTISGFTPSSVCAGATPSVTITGNHFNNASAVTFNGVAASFTVNSNTQITATLPASATTGPIAVTTASGTGTSASNFTVNPLPVINTITGNTSVCISSTTQLSDITPGGIWTSANTSVATVNASGFVSGISAGTSLIKYTVTNGSGCSDFVSAIVTVNSLPVVSAAGQICTGSSMQLTPSAGGSWASNNTSVATVDANGLVSGLTNGNATLTFTDAFTNCTATTTITVVVSAAIALQPQPQSVCAGAATSFSVSATGTALTYQWYRDGLPLTNGGTISGSTSATLNISPAALSENGTTYYCEIGGTCSSALTSDAVLLTVTEPVQITLQPTASQTFCTGETAILSVTATGATTYQWFNGITPLSDGGNISGATTDTLTITPLTFGDDSSFYYCIVSGTSPCPSIQSSSADIIVNQAPIVNIEPVLSQNVCDGSSASISVSASGGSLTYQWYRGATLLLNGGNISGATTQTLIINPVTPADAGNDYYCVLSNNCQAGIPTQFAELIVDPIPIIGPQTTSTCSQSAFGVTPIASATTIIPANTTYSWPAPTITGGMTGGSAQTGQSSIFGTLNNPTNTSQTATYTVTPTSGTSTLCNGGTFTVIVTVSPKPGISNILQTICSGIGFIVTPTTGGGNIIPAGTTYSWNAPIVTGGITGGTPGSGTSITANLTNPSATAQTATYTITPTSTCVGNPFTLTVTVNPKPAVVASITSQSICSNVAVSPIVISNPASAITSYTWVRNNTVSVTGTASGSSGNIAAGNTYSITGALVNTTAVAQTVAYTITPISNGCTGPAITASVTVEASSVGGTIATTAPAVTPVSNITTVCHFASGMLYLNGIRGNVVRWEYSTNGGFTWAQIDNTDVTHNYVNITQTTVFRAVVQNGPTCALAYSAFGIVNVIPNVKPSPVVATPSTICIGGTSLLTSQSGFATSQQIAAGGAFQTANPAGWLVDGCGNCLSAGGSNTNPAPFHLSATNGGTYSGINYTSIGKFAIANGNFNSVMETPTFNTYGLATATLSFDHAYNLLAGAWAKVELSLDGGATYNIVLAQYNGPGTRTPYNAFPNTSIDMSAYLGQANLKIRFNYHGTVGSSWAIDNISIPEPPLNLTMQWVDSSSGLVISTTPTATVSPTVTTTYAITSMLNGCSSFGPEGTTYVTVTVNPRPTAVIGTNQTICKGGTANFSIALTGAAPWNITYSNGSTTTTVTNVSTNPYTFSVSNILVNQTYTVTSLTDSRCTSQGADLTGSAVVTVLNGTQGLWTGLVSTDWFNCMNWAGGLPNLTVNAVIPAGTPRMPMIDPANSPYAALYSNIAQAQDLIVAAGASVSMASASSSNLEISRDWKNSGTFYPGIGTVTFKGATTNQVQTINVGIKLTETFYNLVTNTSNGAKGISVVDGFQLTIANNLTLLSGDLRLTGEAQLVQNGTAANPTTGTGKLYRDQQGTSSSFNYNYWSSPVSADGANYTVGQVLRDGTNVTTSPFSPGTITFADGVYYADGALASPIKLSNSWIYKYTAISNDYFSWQYIGSTGSLKVGEGFTLKGTDGTAAFTSLQNYVFAGKPNNGNINLTISLGQSYLIGNPYPSALDADKFIKANIKDGGTASTNVFNGALYFWDHFGGHTHFLQQYIGGYATYTLMGGVVAIANDPLNINDGSAGIKVPTRYVAVGQGFFINTNTDPLLTTNNPNLTSPITGGTVAFNNAQRAFRTEISGSSVFFRQNAITAVPETDLREKIRLRFDSPTGLHRRLLVGVDEFASDNFDPGFDAQIIDVNGEDMYWQIPNGKLVIQAVSDFGIEQILPLAVKVTGAGNTAIAIDALENIPDSVNIYLFDKVTGNYHDLQSGEFSVMLPAGEYTDRFSVRFSSSTALATTGFTAESLDVSFSENILHVRNVSDHDITNAYFFNMLGQSVASWNVGNQDQLNIELPLRQVAQGTYIVKFKTTSGYVSKKIMVK
jgi:hypothetical protein